MDIWLYVGLFVVSLTVLLKASDWFVDSAEMVGLSWGISPFVIGITVVAFGTSLPELATSVAAVLGGQSEIVVGNVVGSNITNIALVLGLSAIAVKQIDLEYNIWHIDMPFLWGSAFLLWFALSDQQFTLVEALIFLGGLAIFLAYSLKGSTSDTDASRVGVSWTRYVLLVASGAMIWLGAEYTITAITEISARLGVAPKIIALSAVAVGTSLPEIIVSVSAARRGKSGIAVGNVLGSNIFNTYAVMGLSRLVGPLAIPDDILSTFLPLMIMMTVLFGVMANNRVITRWEGSLLILFFLVFLAEIFKQA